MSWIFKSLAPYRSIVLVLSLFLIVLSSCQRNRTKAPRSPNIVIVMADDQGWGDLSVHNNPFLSTPNIDSFKIESTSLDRFFVSPVCAPTRASLLSGKWAISTGAWGVTNRDEVMRSETVTIAEILKENGYTTGVFGKWHNGAQYPENPKGQGFDNFLGFTAGHWNNYFDTTLKNIEDTPIKTKGYITDVFTDAAIDFIKKEKENPFFCYIPYNAPHSPFQIPDQYFDRYKNKGLSDKDASIYGMCENMDDNFGRVLKVLEDENLSENTIVIFMSDNGPNGKRYNGNMKGIKATNDEGGTRVPFFIRWPDKIPKNKTITSIAAHIDVLPTLLSLAEINYEKDHSFDGKDISPLLLTTSNSKEERFIFSHWSGLSWRETPGSVRNNKYRLVLEKKDTTLYDIISDPYQEKDLYGTFPKVSQEMVSAYDRWIKKMFTKGVDKRPISIGYTEAKETIIEAHELNTDKGLAYYGKEGWANDWITQWDAIEDTIKVDLKIHKDGNYTFELIYNCEQSQLGSQIEIDIQGKKITSELIKAFSGDWISSPDRIKRKEVYERTWGVMDVGNINLKKGSSELKVYAPVIAQDSVMSLKGIRIIYN